MTGPPRPARLLLRLLLLGRRRDEIEDDLSELFERRVRAHGCRHASRRYYRDVASLLRAGPMRTFPNGWAGRSAPAAFGWLDPGDLRRDVVHAARLLRRSPGVVAVAVAGLGLAIGISTSVFTLINAILLQSGGIAHPASVVRVMRAHENGIGTAWPYSAYAALRTAVPGVRLEAWLSEPRSFRVNPETADHADVQFVSGGYLGALAGRAALGRLLTDADDTAVAPAVAVMSHGYWSRRLGGDPQVLGRTIRFDGVPVTLVGVAPRGFSGATDAAPAFWVALRSYHVLLGGTPIDDRATNAVAIVGRLGDGTTREQAESRLGAAAVHDAPAPLPDNTERVTGVRLFAGHGALSRSNLARIALIVAVIAAVLGLVLLLACVNVANLLLASGISRQREIGVRLALGASAGRVIRQLLTESLCLGVAGGVLGLLASRWMVPILARVTQFPPNTDIVTDARVYAFIIFASLLAGVGAGLLPSRHAVRQSLLGALKGASTSAEPSRPSRARATLIGVQAAASVVLLVLAALTLRGMVRATRVDIGFDADRLIVLSPVFPRGGDTAARAAAYWDAVGEAVRAIPGVRSTSLASHPPFGEGNRVTVIGRGSHRHTIYHHDTDANYFASLGLAILRGRAYTAAEAAGHAEVAVISQSLAATAFAGEDPVGMRLDRVMPESTHVIVGVAADALTARLRERSASATYQPLPGVTAARLIVRVDGDATAAARSIRSVVEAVDPRVRVDLRLVADGLARQVREPRVVASLTGILAAFALALAVVGVYGVTTFVVGQRRHEIGVRIALGAGAGDVMRLLLSESLRPVVYGVGAGLILTVLASRVFLARAFSGLLYGGSPLDPIAFGAAIGVLLTAAAAAVILPARRAVAVDPATALRHL